MSKLIVICLAVLAVLAGCVSSLKVSDKGVCVVKTSLKKTRTKLVTYVTKKWCGKKKCVGRKSVTEPYTITTNQTVCCNGWEYKSEEDICTPHCSTGCFGGNCTQPDVCECQPPLTLHKNTCIKPICDKPCRNSQCIDNNCVCNIDFVPYNATDCAPKCEKGFVIDDSLVCRPVCDNNCTNGYCVAPNVCGCFEGYIKTADKYFCEPYCELCVNSKCVSPNKCECFDGYVFKDDKNCVPKCSCHNGECVDNVCICSDGFTKTDGACVPKCDRCLNGNCTSLGDCVCNKGFVKSSNDSSMCIKSCSVECNGTCDPQGNCIPAACKPIKTEKSRKWVQKKYCGRRKCTKKDGYYQSVAGTIPVCCQDYEYVSDTDSCQPTCRPSCERGRCISPNVCQCEPPLVLISKTKCGEPTCDPLCFNSKCIANNTCSCLEKFIYHNATHCKPICPAGFSNDPQTLICNPDCDPPCQNAKCNAPNQCSCIADYEKDLTKPYKCNPICKDCRNGNCVAPNDCQCHEGYTKNNSSCLPICDKECSNGFCSDPNVCSCHQGYKLSKDNKYYCSPICEPKCVNASCVALNTCACQTGYESLKYNWICEPKCDSCKHGKCIDPNVCKCNEGYSMKDGKNCTPDCDSECINGYCSSPNICTCNKGYIPGLNNSCIPICNPGCIGSVCVSPNKCKCLHGYEPGEDSFKCLPRCSFCKNGVCIAPENCTCHTGYVMNTEDLCLPHCKDQCVNGNCVAPDECECWGGYKKNDTQSNFCYKPCQGPCDNGRCIHGECLCDVGYELINETCINFTPINCTDCVSLCNDSGCSCPNGRPCYQSIESSKVILSTSLAGIGGPWIVGSAILGLLFVIVIIVTAKLWKKRKQYTSKEDTDYGQMGSILYHVPNTLVQKNPTENDIPLQTVAENDDMLDDKMDDEKEYLDDKTVLNHEDEVVKRLLQSDC